MCYVSTLKRSWMDHKSQRCLKSCVQTQSEGVEGIQGMMSSVSANVRAALRSASLRTASLLSLKQKGDVRTCYLHEPRVKNRALNLRDTPSRQSISTEPLHGLRARCI